MSEPTHLEARLSPADWQLGLLVTEGLRYLALFVLPFVAVPPLVVVGLSLDGELLFLAGLLAAGVLIGAWAVPLVRLIRPLTDRRTYTRLPVKARIDDDGLWVLLGDRGRGLGGADLKRVVRVGQRIILKVRDDDLLVLKGEPAVIREAAERLSALKASGSTTAAAGDRPAGLEGQGRTTLTLADWAEYDERYAPSKERRLLLGVVAVINGLLVVGGLLLAVVLAVEDPCLAASVGLLSLLLGLGFVSVARQIRGHTAFFRQIRAHEELYTGPVEVAWGPEGVWMSGRVDRWLAWSAIRSVGRSKRYAFLPTSDTRGVVVPRDALEPDSDGTLRQWGRWHNHARKNPPRPPTLEEPPSPAEVDPFQAPRDP